MKTSKARAILGGSILQSHHRNFAFSRSSHFSEKDCLLPCQTAVMNPQSSFSAGRTYNDSKSAKEQPGGFTSKQTTQTWFRLAEMR